MHLSEEEKRGLAGEMQGLGFANLEKTMEVLGDDL
jgi:hypothetical protein